MKLPISKPVFLILALAGVATADLPKKAPYTKYSGLWTNSPFTSKPPPPEAGPDNNPLDDYALIGCSSLGTKLYRVTIMNKKKPDEPRIYVESNHETKGFKILGVTRKAGDPLGTVVRMSNGSQTGTVTYDQKLLTLATPAAKVNPQNPQQGLPGQPGGPQLIPGQQPQLQNGQPQAQRQPRPRVVPPPTPQVNGQMPPGQIQQGQVPQGQPGQNIPQTNRNERPQRRGN